MSVSIQSLINHNNKINYEMLNDYIAHSGLVEVNDFDLVRPGDAIKYIRTTEDGNDKFVNAWVCVQNNPDYFLYKWWNNTIWSLQKNEIVKLYYKPLVKKSKKEKPIEFKKPADTGIEIYIGDTLVHRARDNYSKNKFMSTDKYKRAVESGKFVVRKK